MKNVARIIIVQMIFIVSALQSIVPTHPLVLFTGFAAPVYAEEEWQVEFDVVCKKTQDPSILSAAELRELIARCDKLKSNLEKLEEHIRKVPLIRLKMARKLLVFTLETKGSPIQEGRPGIS